MANNEKIPVGVLGATGSVGQKFIELLSNHPWFRVLKWLHLKDRQEKNIKMPLTGYYPSLPKDVAERL